jgi:ryanodine receptor 2
VDIEHEANSSPFEIEVTRIPGSSDSSPALKISSKLFESQEKVAFQFLKLSLPVVCQDYFISEIEWMKKKHALRTRKRNLEIQHQQMVDIAPPRQFQHQQMMFNQQFPITPIMSPMTPQNTNLEQHMLSSGFSMTDIKGLQRAYSEEAGDELPLMSPDTQAIFGVQHPLQMAVDQMTPEIKRDIMFGKTKSFDNTLTVPSMAEAQKMMRGTKKSNSIENLDQFGLSGLSTPTLGSSRQILSGDVNKKRSKSPFNKLFGKKEPQTPLKSPRSGEDAPTISIYGSSFQNLAGIGNLQQGTNLLRPVSPSPNTSVRRGSKVNITESLPDESNDLLDMNNLDLVDEYFYGVRIFPGNVLKF